MQQRRFDAPIIVLVSALLASRLSPLLPRSIVPWLGLGTNLLFVVGLVWLSVRLLDWWGEEAPVFHPRKAGKLVRLNYREAQARLRLIELFAGDARMARRQIRILKERYPQRSEQWYWERAIVDLEADLSA
ncbi:hypothetical protein IQ266_09420 [filamentous cyanobacterium LEGE 11480]|uniref:Uncharacterized protein n=1 Tax=Romeriopsis navalis LEGE 11480 TaxID=2777977 RepID=A0A928Z461_9CYAN|nr:hypothetical protein [Romeriopsis navalis]MBE9029945.1 hypothetical protein [Romeriopsis navalis LEGE 11480]